MRTQKSFLWRIFNWVFLGGCGLGFFLGGIN